MMKFKDFEGSYDEINNFFQNNGLNLSNYLNIKDEPENKKADRRWIFLLIGLFIIFNISNCKLEQNSEYYIPVSILTLGSLGCLIAIVQLNYEKWIVSTIAGVCGLLMMVISFKILTPQETVKVVKDKSEQYLDQNTEKETTDKK